MKDRLVAMTMPFAAGLALVAVAAYIAELPTTASVLLGLAVAIGLLGIQLRFDQVDRAMAGQVAAIADTLAVHTDLLRQQTTRVRRDLRDTRADLAAVPADTAYLHRLLGDVASGSAALPALGQSAAGSQTLLAVTAELRRRSGAVTVVDVGAGGSTVLEALALKARGSGHVYALATDAGAAESTRTHLSDHGASSYATVIEAPLTRVEVPGAAATEWHDLAGLGAGSIDVLVLGADPAGPERAPALRLLADRLTDGALVVVDGAVGAEDRALIETWDGLELLGRRFVVAGVQGRSLLLRVALTADAAPAPRKRTARSTATTTTRARKTATTKRVPAKKATTPRPAKKAAAAKATAAKAGAATAAAPAETSAEPMGEAAVPAEQALIDGVPDFGSLAARSSFGASAADAVFGAVPEAELGEAEQALAEAVEGSQQVEAAVAEEAQAVDAAGEPVGEQASA